MGYLSRGSDYIDALCIAEPWIHSPEHANGLSIPGYTEILSLQSTSYTARPYGGLILYIQTVIYHEVHILQTHMGTKHNIIWIKLPGVTFGFLYLPPATSSHVRAWDTDIMDSLCGELLLYEVPYVLIGDFNAHIFGDRNHQGRRLLEMMESFDLLCMNSGNPTYVHAGAATTIDLALVSAELLDAVRFKVGDLCPESLHVPLHLIYKGSGALPEPALTAIAQLPHPKIPRITNPSLVDNKMDRLLKKVNVGAAKDVGAVPVIPLQYSPGMSTIRRRLRALGKRHESPKPLTEISNL